MPRTLLVVSGARQAVPVIARARRMGLRVLVADGIPDAPGFRIADAGLLAGTGDVEATVEAARAYAARTPIDGVVGIGADVDLTAAAVADALELPGLRRETAALIGDELAVRARLGALGIPVPWTAAVPSEGALERIAAERGAALVVRAVERSGAGVMLARGMDAAWAFQLAAASSPSGRVMAEEHVAGPRLRCEGLVVRGKARMIACADLSGPPPARAAPFVLDVGADLPSRIRAGVRERIESMVAAATAGLGIARGPITAEAVVGCDGPVLIAFGARLSGGYVATHEVPLSSGVDLVAAAILLALGDEPRPESLRSRWSQAVARRAVLPPSGTVVEVHGVAEAAAGDGIALLEVPVAAGERIAPGAQAGIVIAVGETLGIAAARAGAAVARIRVVTAPALSAAATLH